MPISTPEVAAGNKTDSIIGYKKRRVSLKQTLPDCCIQRQMKEMRMQRFLLLMLGRFQDAEF